MKTADALSNSTSAVIFMAFCDIETDFCDLILSVISLSASILHLPFDDSVGISLGNGISLIV